MRRRWGHLSSEERDFVTRTCTAAPSLWEATSPRPQDSLVREVLKGQVAVFCQGPR